MGIGMECRGVLGMDRGVCVIAGVGGVVGL